jgi:hypothetical protein
LLLFFITVHVFSYCNIGNSYDLNKCLISKIKRTSSEYSKAHVLETKKYCEDRSLKYSGGTYQAIYYGHCYLDNI